MITSTVPVSNKISPTATRTAVKKLVSLGKLRGASFTDLGVLLTKQEWAEYASMGLNWARFHHMEWMLTNGHMTINQVLQSMTWAMECGVRVSVGLCEKLGETTDWGMQGFKDELVNKRNPKAEEIYKAHIQRMTPILQHPACFACVLSNETAHMTTPENASRFWDRWSPMVRQINPHLLLSDLGDAWQTQDTAKRDAFLRLIAKYDFFGPHQYGGGEDFGPHGKGSWIDEVWHIDGIYWWMTELRKLNPSQPVMVMEFGSYDVSRYYIENEIAFQLVAAQCGWSTCQFCYWDGKVEGVYNSRHHPARLACLSFGAYMVKNAGDLVITRGDDKIVATGTKVSMPDRRTVKVGGYVWRTDQCPDWARLTKVV